MMSTNNILSPANGKPIIVPTQDIVLGLYYLSQERAKEPGEGMVFNDIGEIEHALFSKAITLHAKIKCRYKTVDAEGKPDHPPRGFHAGPHADRRHPAAQSARSRSSWSTACCASRRSAS